MGYGEITDDLTGEVYHFHHTDILGKRGFRDLFLWRNVEFTPTRKDNFSLVASNVNHLENKNQWDSIPLWYPHVRKSHGPLCEMPRVKPLIYKDAKWTGKY